MYRSRVAKSVYLGMSLHTRTKLRPPRKRVSNLFAEQKHSRILWPLKPRRRHRSWLLWLVSLGKYEWVPLLWQNTDSPRLASPGTSRIRIRYMCERALRIRIWRSSAIQRYKDTEIQVQTQPATGYHVTSLRSIEWCLTYEALRNKLNMRIFHGHLGVQWTDWYFFPSEKETVFPTLWRCDAAIWPPPKCIFCVCLWHWFKRQPEATKWQTSGSIAGTRHISEWTWLPTVVVVVGPSKCMQSRRLNQLIALSLA